LAHAIEQAESDQCWCERCVAADLAGERDADTGPTIGAGEVNDLLARLDDWALGLTAVRKDCLEAATVIRSLTATQDAGAGMVLVDAAELASLRKRVARQPTLFWVDEDPEVGYRDLSEAINAAINHWTGGVAAIRHGCELGVAYYAVLPPADDSDSDDQWEVECDTAEGAKAALAAERVRRLAAKAALAVERIRRLAAAHPAASETGEGA
jgi:hypothetical protein